MRENISTIVFLEKYKLVNIPFVAKQYLCLQHIKVIFAKQLNKNCGSSSVGRATAFQAVGRGFEPRLPLA